MKLCRTIIRVLKDADLVLPLAPGYESIWGGLSKTVEIVKKDARFVLVSAPLLKKWCRICRRVCVFKNSWAMSAPSHYGNVMRRFGNDLELLKRIGSCSHLLFQKTEVEGLFFVKGDDLRS